MAALLRALSVVIASWHLSAAAAGCLIAVDIGHYKERPGATSAHGRSEFELNLALGKEVAASFEQRGCRGILIGAAGDVRDLRERTNRARGADFFISVHHDSTAAQFLQRWIIDGVERLYTDRLAGFSLFVSHANVQSELSLRCASSIGAALQQHGFTPSLFHADPTYGEPRPFADRDNGVHWFDDLVVLKTASQPAVLLEAGMLVNPAEELMLQRLDVRRHIADAIIDAVAQCLHDR